MFVYNITIKVDNEIVKQWLQWQREVHIPELMATNLFTDSKIFKLLEQDDPDASTYILQYFITAKENYNTFINEYAPGFAKKALEKWGNKFIDFTTLMRTVH
jgi:hypothetical protein